MGSADEMDTLPEHASENFLDTASAAVADPALTLYVTSAAADVARSTLTATDPFTVSSASAATTASVVSSATTCAASAYFDTAPVTQSTCADAPSARSPEA